MVNEFKIARIPIIHFGPGIIKILPEILSVHKGRIMLLISKSLEESTSQLAAIESRLSTLNIDFDKIQIHGEPTVSIIDGITEQFRHQNIKAICSIGGGSAIDAGKAVSAMLLENGSIQDFLEGIGTKQLSGNKVPFIAIPATAGTGSEATKNAVISGSGTPGFKRSLRHENYVPDIAIIDPELSSSCTPETTAASGMDAFTQLMESYFSTNSNPFTDSLALNGLAFIRDSLLPAYDDGNNISARTGMAFAALNSGITLANAGLGVVHGFASSIGGKFEIPHGVICGTLLAEANRANIEIIRSENAMEMMGKLSVVAKLFTPDSARSEADRINEFSDLLFNWTLKLKLPGFGAYGMKNSDVQGIVRITDQKYNPVKLPERLLTSMVMNRI